MRSADISMLIIIQMYSKLKRVHTTVYVSSGVYSMTKCGKSGNKAVYYYKNDHFSITRGRQNVPSEYPIWTFDLISP